MHTWRRVAGSLVVLFVLAGAVPVAARTLSVEERIAAQRKLEEVYWKHRIWPGQNPGPKPPLSSVLSEEVLAARVDDLLRGAAALEALWNRPITHEEVQAELDRMARETQSPDVLRELYAALGNDPDLIAETLARPALVQKHLQDLYSADDRLHGALRAKAYAARTGAVALGDLENDGAAIHRSETRRDPADLQAWNDAVRAMAKALGVPPDGGTDAILDRLPVGRMGRVIEDADGFRVASVVEKTPLRLSTAVAFWPKEPFDDWWAGERKSHAPAMEVADDDPYTLAPVTGLGCTDDTWTAIPGPNVPDIREEHSAVWTGTEMIVFGGFDDWTAHGDGGRYNPATDTWLQLPTSLMPTGRMQMGAVWTGTRVVVWGGTPTSFGANLNTGGRYDPVANTWQSTTTTGAPGGRSLLSAVWTGTEMIVWGGFDTNLAGAVNTGGRYNPSTDTWTLTSTVGAPAARYYHVAVWTGTDMIIWGGTGSPVTNTGGRYRPSSNTWTPTSTGTNVPTARQKAQAVWSGTEMIVWGASSTLSGGRYNPTTDTWLPTSTVGAPSNRTDHTAVWTGTEMIVWGGGVPAFNTGGRYNPATDTWTATSTGPGVPSPRYWHTAVWTGTEMIVWGGRDPNGSFRTGGRYNPTTNTWTPTSTGGDAPSARANAKAVWTGSEMIAWGGLYIGTRLNTGARYDPATSSWRPTFRISSGLNMPGPRDSHMMVWTGSEALVWGGTIGTSQTNSGFRYNPVTDSWTAMSSTGVPVPRFDCTAIWTGTEMIIWGGISGSYLNTGGRYKPSTDTWVATSTGANVPLGRQYNVAAWTGSRMAIWGGSITASVTNTGALYDPVADAWTPMTTVNAPAARTFHGGAWTGQRLIVWGGRDAVNTNLATGGKYDPATDTWAPITTAPSARNSFTSVWTGQHVVSWGGNPGPLNTGYLYEETGDTWTPTSTAAPVPSPRSNHTSVWTGSEMIVWSGAAGSNYFSDGGRYCPITCPTWFRDADGDGHGKSSDSKTTCTQPGGYVSTGDDCNDSDPTVFARAAELTNLLFLPDKITIAWDSGAVLLYDVLRGSLAEFPVGSGPSEICLAPAINSPSFQDGETPLPDRGFWYLVRGRNACGGGPYGYRTGPIEEVSAACP